MQQTRLVSEDALLKVAMQLRLKQLIIVICLSQTLVIGLPYTMLAGRYAESHERNENKRPRLQLVVVLYVMTF